MQISPIRVPREPEALGNNSPSLPDDMTDGGRRPIAALVIARITRLLTFVILIYIEKRRMGMGLTHDWPAHHIRESTQAGTLKASSGKFASDQLV